MHPSVARRAGAYFADANAKLAALTGRDWSWADPECGGLAALPPSTYVGSGTARAPGQQVLAALQQAQLPPAALPPLPMPAAPVPGQ